MSTDLFPGSDPLRTLSLWEPWASLIFAGYKLHETRHWPTRVRGTIAIHAAKSREGFDCDPELDALCTFAFGKDWRGDRPLGCILGVADLTGCLPITGAPILEPSDLLSGHYAPGRYAFRLERARAMMEPLPLKGKQGFFNWLPPADLEARLGPAVDHAETAARWSADRAGVSNWPGLF